MNALATRLGLNREKIAFGVCLVLAGGYAVWAIGGGATGIAPLAYGTIKRDPPSALAQGRSVESLYASADFSDYWAVRKGDLLTPNSDWRPLAPVRLAPPALPALRPIMLPTIPAPRPAIAGLYVRPREKLVTLPDLGLAVGAGAGSDAAPPGAGSGSGSGSGSGVGSGVGSASGSGSGSDVVVDDAITAEWKKSELWPKVRLLDKVYLKKDGAAIEGLIEEDQPGQVIIRTGGKNQIRVLVPRADIDEARGTKGIERRLALEAVYDQELEKLGEADGAKARKWIGECMRYAFTDVAVRHLDKQIALHPQDPEPYLLAGRYFGEVYAYDALASLFARAEANQIRRADTFAWGQARFLAQPFVAQVDKALELYATVTAGDSQLDPTARAQAQLERARLLRRLGRHAEAEVLFKELAATEEAALCDQVGCLIEQGKLADAAAVLAASTSTSARVVGLRGTVALLDPATKLADALALLAQARLADPGAYAHAHNLGVALLYAEAWDSAKAAFDLARALALDDPSLPNLGHGLADHLAGKPEVAIAGGYAKALQANPEANAQVHFLLGMASLALATPDVDAAKQSFATATRIAFDFAEAHLRLGVLAIDARDTVAARMHLEQASALAPDDLVAASYLGWALIEAGDYAAAEAAYRRCLERAPASNPVRESLAWITNARGDQAEAERALRKIDSDYARLAIEQVVENQRRTTWRDAFARTDTSGQERVLRKWTETEDAGVQIRLDAEAAYMDGMQGAGQTHADRKTILDRELPRGTAFIQVRVRLKIDGAAGAFVGVALRKSGKIASESPGGAFFGVTPDGKLFYADYAKAEPLRFLAEEFRTYKVFGPAKDHTDVDGWLPLEVARYGDDKRQAYAFRANGVDLVDVAGKQPGLTIPGIGKGAGIRVGMFGQAEKPGTWSLRADDFELTATADAGGR